MGYKLFCSTIALLLCTHVYAESALHQITVTPEKRPIRIIDTLNSIEVITSNNIKNSGFTSMSEILDFSSSISIGSNGGFGQTKSIFMRGTESNHTKVLVNGIELNPGTLGVPSIQHIPPEIIERVEISKSGMSSLYGKDSIGGVINIITKQGSGDVASIMSGRFNTKRFSVSKNIQMHNQKLSLNISRMLSDSYKAKISSNQDHAYENKVIDINYKIVDDFNNYNFDLYHNIGSTEYDSFGNNLSQIHKDNHFRAMLERELGNKRMMISYIRKGNEINQSAASATDYTHTKTDSIIIENLFNDHTLFGVSYSDESMYELSYGTSFKNSNKIREFYFNTSYKPSDKVYLNLGSRNTNHSIYGNFLTGNFNIGKKINDSNLFYSSISKTFRAPDSTDLYGYSGNANLEPEESISYEIGFKSISSFGDITLSFFRNDIDNLIESDGSIMQNINEARIKGLEFNLINKIDNNLKYNIKYTYQEPDDITNDTMLSRRPRNKFVTTISNQFSSNNILTFTFSGQSKRDNSIYDIHRLGSYLKIDVNYMTNIYNYDVGFKINNIFNKKYRLAHNYNTEGQSVYLTLTKNF